ncbi:MAG: hypothetical protein IIV61_09275 [Oscillospiraceae bacterium]|nr:hypothetical protein [Oscillospiraceae bacterium]
MSKTKKYLLAFLVTLAITFIGGFLMGLLPPVGTGIILLGTLVLMGLFVGFVVHLMKLVVGRVSRDVPQRSTSHEDYRWWQVAVALVILPPLGLFYVIHKTNREKELFYINGVKMAVIGITFLLLTLPPILLILFTGIDDPSGLVFLLFFPGIFTLAGAAMTVLGIRLARRGKQHDRLLHLILQEKITRIERLCSLTSTTYPKVTDRVQWLIDNGMLPGAYIYHVDKEIIIPRISPRIAIKCVNCNGTSVLYANDERVCVYCGGRL